MVEYEHWPAATVLRRVRLTASHRPTGSARHYAEERLLPPPAELVIARFDGATRRSLDEELVPYSAYYLFYLDEAGEEMTDFAVGSLEEALRQAEQEFQIKPDEWVTVG